MATRGPRHGYPRLLSWTGDTRMDGTCPGPRLPVPPRDSVGPRFLIPPPRITDIVTWKLRAATSLKQQQRDPSYALPPKLRFPSYEQTPQSLQAKLYTLGVSRNLFCLPCTSQDSVISLIAAMFEF